MFTGYTFRGRVEHRPDGDAFAVQLKDLVNYATVAFDGLTRIHSEAVAEKFFLRAGDVLLIGKGANNYAVVFNQSEKRCIPSSAFFVVRPTSDQVYPPYIAWYLNQVNVQMYYKGSGEGTYVPNISLKTVTSTQIALPGMEIQKKIMMIEKLRQREQAILEEIMEKRKQLISASLLKLVH
ncbi:MAG: restriction endonuclease subunit S [Bacteroidia bacterium]|nr:restriction endonuclease subunit S [Bacteroidia bacterium]